MAICIKPCLSLRDPKADSLLVLVCVDERFIPECGLAV